MPRSNSSTLSSTADILVLFVDELSITIWSLLEMAEHKLEMDVIDSSKVLILTFKLLLDNDSPWWEFLTTSTISFKDLEMGDLPREFEVLFSGSGSIQQR